MKKTYKTPNVKVFQVNTCSLFATSINVNDNTNGAVGGAGDVKDNGDNNNGDALVKEGSFFWN